MDFFLIHLHLQAQLAHIYSVTSLTNLWWSVILGILLLLFAVWHWHFHIILFYTKGVGRSDVGKVKYDCSNVWQDLRNIYIKINLWPAELYFSTLICHVCSLPQEILMIRLQKLWDQQDVYWEHSFSLEDETFEHVIRFSLAQPSGKFVNLDVPKILQRKCTYCCFFFLAQFLSFPPFIVITICLIFYACTV